MLGIGAIGLVDQSTGGGGVSSVLTRVHESEGKVSGERGSGFSSERGRVYETERV